DGNNLIHLAASRPGHLSRFLLTNKDTVEKINVNQKNRNGETALHIAAKAGNTPMVRKLIASGANVFVQDAQGRTALDLAKEFNQLDVVQIFHSVQGGNIELTSDELDIENLVFRGGGVKGYAYVSALETFDREVKKLSSIRRVAGASAGAITAALVAFNFNIDELKDKLENKNLKDFLDPTSAKDSNLMDEIKALVAEGVNFSSLWTHQKAAFLSRVKSLFDKVYATLDKQQGLQSGDQFREWFIQTIAEKIEKTSLAYGNGVKKEGFDAKAFAESITFEEVESAILVNDSGQAILDDDGLPKKAFKELYVYGTNTATKMPILFSAKHTPNACVVDAVRISMAFPFVFAPWQIYIKENGQRILDPRYKDIKFSDGGIYKNYAPDSFDYDPITGLYRYNPKTVGFNLVSKEDKDFYEQGIISGNVSTDTLFRWLGGIFGSLLGSENFIHAQSQDHDRTIYIEVHVSSMSFDITDKDKLEMSESARAGIHDFKNRRVAMHVPTNLSPETVGNLVRIGILKQTNHKIFALSQYFKSINPKDVLALYAQANEEEIWLLRQLINPHLHQDENGNTAMHIASVYGFEEVLQRFRQLHFDMSMLNKMGHPSDSDEDHVNSCSLDELSETSQISNDEKERILFGENQVLKNKVSKLEEDIRQLQGQLAEAQKSALDDRMSVIQELTRAKDTALAQKEKMIQQLTESKTTELAAKETEIQALTQAKNVALAEKDSEIQALTQARDAALAMKDHEIQALTQARDAALAMKDREIQALTQARDAALTAKDAELQRLRNEKVISSQQQQAISNRILERMDARTQVGIAVSALDALLVIERQEAGKVNFLSIKGRNKPEKVKALEMLIEQLKSNNAPASEIINMVDQLHSGVLRAGVFSHRTSDCLDALISAEYHAENARTFGTFDSFEL
ncbi:MAG: patatin-like phospholipase family protein, partial [Gammaproteobacteria bacterium]